jgi:hypothetical protein
MNPLSIECDVHFTKHGRGRKELEAGAEPPAPTPGRVPRVARLLALAHRLERLVRTGVVKDYAEAARLGHVTRARISQYHEPVESCARHPGAGPVSAPDRTRARHGYPPRSAADRRDGGLDQAAAAVAAAGGGVRPRRSPQGRRQARVGGERSWGQVTAASPAPCRRDDAGWRRLEGQSAAGSPTLAHVATGEPHWPRSSPERREARVDDLVGRCGDAPIPLHDACAAGQCINSLAFALRAADRSAQRCDEYQWPFLLQQNLYFRPLLQGHSAYGSVPG